MKRIFYSLLFAGTVWTAAGQNPPEIKTPDRKTAERIEEYYLSKMLPDSVQIKALPLSGGLFQSFDHHDAGDFDEFAHGDPNQIRTAPHRYRSLQNTQRLVLDFQRPGPELESLSGRASRRPDPLVSRTAVTTPILRCAAGHRGRPYRFSNRHSVSRSEFAPGNFRFRLPHPQIWVFMRNGFRQKNRFFAHLLMCSL